MSKLGGFLWCIGSGRLHRDGDGYTFVGRWYHPAYWILFIVMLPIAAILGEPIFEAMPYKLSRYWELNKNKLEWVTPFDKI